MFPKSWLLLLMVFLPLFSSAEGNTVGNGGGVICIRGVCKTLLEAGMRLNPEYEGVWLPTSKHYELVGQQVQKELFLPTDINSAIYNRTFARTDHFRRVDVVDPEKLESIKRQYLDLAAEAGFPMDPETFEVVAFSSDDTVTPAMTYLLPRFFELDTRQQGRILVHEGLYRGRPSSHLKYILQLESAMFELGQSESARCTGREAKFKKACVNQKIAAYRLNFLSKMDMFGSILSALNIDQVAPEDAEHLFNIKNIGKNIDDQNRTLTSIEIDPASLLTLAKLEPRIPYMLSRVNRIDVRFKEDSYVQGCDSVSGDYFHYNDKTGKTQVITCGSGTSAKIFEFANPGNIELTLPQ